jgi:hypothetical protein
VLRKQEHREYVRVPSRREKESDDKKVGVSEDQKRLVCLRMMVRLLREVCE